MMDAALIGALLGNIISFGVGVATMLKMAREQGRWQGTTEEKLRSHSRQHQTHETRLNAHSHQIGELKVGLAGHLGKAQGQMGKEQG
jgi:hypothetical protein